MKTGVASGGLKLQCVAIATFFSYVYYQARRNGGGELEGRAPLPPVTGGAPLTKWACV